MEILDNNEVMRYKYCICRDEIDKDLQLRHFVKEYGSDCLKPEFMTIEEFGAIHPLGDLTMEFLNTVALAETVEERFKTLVNTERVKAGKQESYKELALKQIQDRVDQVKKNRKKKADRNAKYKG